MTKRVLAFMAHPDDVEFTCGGTLARLKKEAGCEIAIATMTSGDCGSVELGPDKIGAIRHEEAKAAASVLQGEYYCAGSRDLFILYDEQTMRNVTEIVRRARPDVVLTAPPVDYMLDHEVTSTLVRAACFGAPIPNVFTYADKPAEPLGHVPHLYYVDPVEFKDIYGKPVEPGFIVDITDVMETKEKMLACHASQREWLRAHHGMDEYIEAMRRFGAERGRKIGSKYGEGFRQHLGHAYPQDNVITELLGL
jgi:LmbE family N-acetylglucosaminyl deacetylase